ncbi:13163_t:CDS:1, partial [Ambispora gerdemannii]
GEMDIPLIQQQISQTGTVLTLDLKGKVEVNLYWFLKKSASTHQRFKYFESARTMKTKWFRAVCF